MGAIPYRPGASTAPIRSTASARRRFLDAAARWVVTLGGMATIASIAAILGFICIEVYPLLRQPAAFVRARFDTTLPAPPAAVLSDERREALGLITEVGTVHFALLRDGSPLTEVSLGGLNGERVVAATVSGAGEILLATSGGKLIATRIHFREPGTGVRRFDPRIERADEWALSPEGGEVRLIAAATPQGGGVTAVFVPVDGRPRVFAVAPARGLFAKRLDEVRRELPLEPGETATALEVSSDGRYAFIGSSRGTVRLWDLRGKSGPALVDATHATSGSVAGVTALELLIGDQTLVVGDEAGGLSTWFRVRDGERDSGWRLRRIHDFEGHRARVSSIAASPRDKSFLAADDSGRALLHHSTTGRTRVVLPGETGDVAALAFTPKADGAVAVDHRGRVIDWEIHDDHPETTWSTLFGKVWYEGYAEPAHVWQSTGGSDAFEPKLSLIPLIFGTLKGTLYALLFAIPIAVLGALYTSQFAHPRLRSLVKPTVELMAALPSVVLGFLAGLWLAPAIEDVVPGVLAMFAVVPAIMLGAGAVWNAAPPWLRGRMWPGTEAVVLVPLILAGIYACLQLSPLLEDAFFGGNFTQWLFGASGLRYDQRNCLIIGVAMGFAVIPIIFTITEDALSNVPPRLVSGSLALGATRWQTALRVVLPTASAGIFSAVMIGFGRAVGETMIVLMATGNTPIMEWNAFTGMRTLSANIAVEMPEAPRGSTLYRVLFLTALLLFIATFVINTAAELVRNRLRRRYEAL